MKRLGEWKIYVFWISIIVSAMSMQIVSSLLSVNSPLISVQGQTTNNVTIVSGASNPNNKLWYDPQIKEVKKGDSVT